MLRPKLESDQKFNAIFQISDLRNPNFDNLLDTFPFKIEKLVPPSSRPLFDDEEMFLGTIMCALKILNSYFVVRRSEFVY